MRPVRTPSKNPLGFFLEVSLAHATVAILSLIAVFVACIFNTGFALIFQKVIDSSNAYTSGIVTFSVVEFWVIMYPVVVFLDQLSWRFSGFVGLRWSTGIRATAHKRLFEYISGHSTNYFGNRFAGALTNSIANVANGVGDTVEFLLWSFFSTILSIIFSGFLVWETNGMLAGLFFGGVFFIVVLNYFIMQPVGRLSKNAAEGLSKLRGVTVDILTNIAAVQQFARRSFENISVRDAADSHRFLAKQSWQASEIALSVNSFFIVIFFAGVVGTSFFLWRDGAISLGQFVLVTTLLYNLIGTITFIGQAFGRVAELQGQMKEGLGEILTPYEIVGAPGAGNLAVTNGVIEFKDASFAYGERTIFSGFSLSVAGGQRVGVVGPSGAGKSTLVSLLLRQHDLASGSIEIDGQDISKITLDSLRSAIAVVPQESLLFHRTIRENIAYGKPGATQSEIEEAAKRAQAHEFITTLPEGYDTLVGERGVKLSGGQRQRVAIARAILKSAPILVLDEATSSLDSESESAIQVALTELMQGKTVIAIAHRLSTIRAMDRIIVIEEGAVVEDGKHDTLLKKRGGVYARLWKHQAGGFIADEE